MSRRRDNLCAEQVTTRSSLCTTPIHPLEMSKWVSSDRFTMVAPCPLLTRKRPDRCVAHDASIVHVGKLKTCLAKGGANANHVSHQRTGREFRRPAANATALDHSRASQADGHEIRLRRRLVRRLHGARRRQTRLFVPDTT